MNAYQFYKKYGKAQSTAVAISAGTTWNYLYEIIRSVKQPSFAMAERIVAASGGKIKLLPLLQQKSKRPDGQRKRSK